MGGQWKPSWPSLALTLLALTLHSHSVTSGGEVSFQSVGRKQSNIWGLGKKSLIRLEGKITP